MAAFSVCNGSRLQQAHPLHQDVQACRQQECSEDGEACQPLVPSMHCHCL